MRSYIIFFGGRAFLGALMREHWYAVVEAFGVGGGRGGHLCGHGRR